MKSDHSKRQVQVRVLTVNSGDNLQHTLFRLKKGWILQIRPGPSLFGKKFDVYTNHPSNKKETFERNKYRKLEWKTDSISKGDDTAIFVEVPIVIAGSFYFYLTRDETQDKNSAEASGYFLVDPVLCHGKNNEELPMDCIQCETFMAKCLGTLDRWPKTLQVAKECGYNMVHFTPIQELGSSRSGYSLRNQLKLNPEFCPSGKRYTINDVKKIVDMMDKDWGMLSLTDIVLNHTANESEWMKEHPECGYNLVNSPHLRPAYVIDRAVHHFAMEIEQEKWKNQGIPKNINDESHLESLARILHSEILPGPKVEEFYMLNVDKIVQEFRSLISKKRRPSVVNKFDPNAEVTIIQDPEFRRFKSTIDFDLAGQKYNISWADCNDEDRINRCCDKLRQHLGWLNNNKFNEIRSHVLTGVGCIIGTCRYERLASDGPKIKAVSIRHPLVPQYFTHPGPDLTMREEEEKCYGENAPYIMAHNGWVMGDDPLKNFAGPGSNVYLRRELNCWGDSIKLRFGEKPEDCPYLWKQMRQYVEETATIFHGIRLDNCHSTPIYVAEYLLDAARKIRPDLYVIAELFTSSDLTDNVFVNRLGINSLIREAMSAPNSHEEGRLVYRYGGEPVGAFMLPPVRPLVPSVAHAMFLDITHDNKSPCEVRTAWDMLPSTALVNMACCASGSTRGYDEIVPHHIHVVTEERKYPSWSDTSSAAVCTVSKDSGIINCKRILNDLHFKMGKDGFSQVFVDQVTENIVTVTRHSPVTHESIVLVAFTSFRPPKHIQDLNVRPFQVQGKVEKILFEMKVKGKKESDSAIGVPGEFSKDKEYINGINGFEVDIRENIDPKDCKFVTDISENSQIESKFAYNLQEFTPGSVIAFKLKLLPKAEENVLKLRNLLGDFLYKQKISEIEIHNQELLNIVKNLSLSDINRILYRCEQEEKDEGRGWGSYNVPNFGPFIYCGLQGIISVMSNIRVNNDLGHPVCGNIRDGDWLCDYIQGRLKLEKSTEQFSIWLQDKFSILKNIPHYLKPAYFDALVNIVYLALINHSWEKMSSFISSGSSFAKGLGLCSAQFCGVVKSARLPTLSPNLEKPTPPVKDFGAGEVQAAVTISAGLPHFCIGYMRNWGRDTFIALPGNLLVTGRYEEARYIILGFAATLRHGLIPNLLDAGHNARFNCRDSIWFWLYSIIRYIDFVADGHKILKDKVSRLFPKDDSPAQSPGVHDQNLESVIHEALQRHFEGVQFRERNAGFSIDSQMTDEGFNNQVGVDLETGFPFGGNKANCGTWMDKMGSSSKSGNKGKPASPRDGSAVEIVGLCKFALKNLSSLFSQGKYSFESVSRKCNDGNEVTWTYKFWEMKIEENFEKQFWINKKPTNGEYRPDLINRRGIYKDSVGASYAWCDFQLRCNFPIALAVAPEMISYENGKAALDIVEGTLLGPLGIKTLDPSDWSYRGDYDNSNDGNDASVAQGFNYHQGPEWLWPVGWYLRAKLAIACKSGSKDAVSEAINEIKFTLAPRFVHLLSSPWRSLPELTNSNGSYCRDSNPAQAWSTACLLEVLWDLHNVN